MGASGAGAGGSDEGFKNSVETRNKKANEKKEVLQIIKES